MVSAEDVLKGIDADFIKNGSQNISEDDIQKIEQKREKIKKIASKNGPLKHLLNDIKLMLSLVKDYCSGRYRDFPASSFAAVIFTLLYVLNPVDLIPDIIPFIGQLDDAVVVGICLYMFKNDIETYKAWQEKKRVNSPDELRIIPY